MSPQVLLRLLLLLFAAALLPFQPARAATLPTGFAEVKIAENLNPTTMTFAPDGRLFLLEKDGKIRIIKDGALLATNFATVTVDTFNERGLLGIALDPSFSTNGYVYVFYTATTPNKHNRVSRFTASGDVASGGETVIFDLDDLASSGVHNGGALQFGSDGKLYIAQGNNANNGWTQSLENTFGKILRINADGTIPTDNPFYSTTTGKNRAIWAYGLRNPFSMAWQPGTNGKFFINDVGESTWEEVNEGVAGSNYGFSGGSTDGVRNTSGLRDPIFTYRHGSGTTNGNCVVGATFYNPQTTQFPSSYVGKYFFADYNSGWIRYIDPTNLPSDPTTSSAATLFASGITAPLDVKIAPDGSLWYINRGNNNGSTETNTGVNSGSIWKVTYTNSDAPSISSHPSSVTRGIGQSVTFTASASGTGSLSYQWKRNGTDISGANGPSYSLASVAVADSGAKFKVAVTNSFGTATSNEATLTVLNNNPPTATIATPAVGAVYPFGGTVNYSGSGSDSEDGALAASALTWKVDFHHNDHSHPVNAASSGSTTGSFTDANPTESGDIWHRIYLTATDSAGLSTTVYREVLAANAFVWVDDALPTGATAQSDGGDSWDWVTIDPDPFFNTKAHKSNLNTSGSHQHWFTGATATMSVATGDTLFAYVYLDPVNPPTEIMLQWNDGTWDHRAYWGANSIALGTDGTNSRRYIGALPTAGRWTKLTVPASQVGLEGSTVSGMAFTLYNGRATWDKAGKTSEIVAAPDFSPAGGTYTSAQSVTLSTTTTGATIRYTTNGSDVTSSSTVYSGAITVSATTTIKAKAFRSGAVDSNQASATYTINAASFSPTTFSDDFSAATLSSTWGTNSKGTWGLNSGIYQQTSTAAADPKKAMIKNGVTVPADVCIKAKVRVDSWSGGDPARAGVSIGSGNDGHGINLLFRDGNKVRFLDDLRAWGPEYSFTWSTGTWYWMKLKRVGDNYAGKVWADGTVEPTDWPYTWSGRTGRSGGYPGLNGGSGNCTVSFDDVSVTGEAPSPWVDQDINVAANQNGSTNYVSSGPSFTLQGGGDDIWNNQDKFRFIHQDASGDCEIVARVQSVENTDYWAKSGVMIRESTAAGARFVMVVQMPNNEVGMQWRTATDSSAGWNGSRLGGTTSAKYVRLVRSGDTFSGYYKVNSGDSWTLITSVSNVPMGTATKIGLSVTAHTSSGGTSAQNLLSTSTLTDVTVTP